MATGEVRLIKGADFVEVIGATGMVSIKNYDIVDNAKFIVSAAADEVKQVLLFHGEKDYVNVAASEKLWMAANTGSLTIGWVQV